MATVPPPPNKKQKLAAEAARQEAEEAAQIPEDLGNVRIELVDSSSGRPTGLPITVPIAQATAKELANLLNELQGNNREDDPDARAVPYSFSYTNSDNDIIDIEESIYHNLILPQHVKKEATIPLSYTPLAVFRVRAVTRNTASISGHGQPILCVAFHPQNISRMVSGSGDATARIWDCDTGTPFKTLTGHTSWVLVVAYNPDGSLIATGSMDNTVRIWDAATGEAKGGPLKGHLKWVTSLSFEPFHLQGSGRPRVASASKDGTIRIWDAVGHRCDNTLSAHKGTASCVRWGGLGYIYTAGHDTLVRIWNAKTGACVKTLSTHAHWVNHLALSTDSVLRTGYFGPLESVPVTEEAKREAARKRFFRASRKGGNQREYFVTASDDCTMYLWSSAGITESGMKPVARLTGHQKQINHCTFSPDGTIIASCGFDNHVKLWRASDGKFLRTLRGHVADVYQCAFSADSRLLASCSKDSTVKIWDVAEGKLKEDLPGHKDEVYAVDWAPAGEKVASAGRDKTVRLWGR